MDEDADSIPNDENGDVLRRLRAAGDPLSEPRNIDFTVVLPDELAARAFSDELQRLGHRTAVERTGTEPELPWDVVITRFMLPTHADIAQFEKELQVRALPLGGRNDGWGCFAP